MSGAKHWVIKLIVILLVIPLVIYAVSGEFFVSDLTYFTTGVFFSYLFIEVYDSMVIGTRKGIATKLDDTKKEVSYLGVEIDSLKELLEEEQDIDLSNIDQYRDSEKEDTQLTIRVGEEYANYADKEDNSSE